jgi:hypothetical protein
LDRLEVGDRATELLAARRVGEGFVEARLRQPDRERADRDPPGVEDLEELAKARAARAEQVPLGDAAVVEVERALVGCTPADLLVGRGRA